MKLIVFKETGKTEYPQIGQWYQNATGFFVCCGAETIRAYPIYERIEIDVPEGMGIVSLSWYLRDKNRSGVFHGEIRLSRPKLKQWLWERDYLDIKAERLKLVSKEYLTEPPKCGCGWRKVEGSEIEVEE